MINCNIKNYSYFYCMKNITPFIGLGLIVVLLLGFVGYNQIIGNQARQDAIFEQTAKQMEELNKRLEEGDKAIEAFKIIIEQKDSLLILEQQEREKLKKELSRNRNNYNSIAVPLPDL